MLTKSTDLKSFSKNESLYKKKSYLNIEPIPFNMPGFFLEDLILLSKAALSDDWRGAPLTLLKPSISLSLSMGPSNNQCFFAPKNCKILFYNVFKY